MTRASPKMGAGRGRCGRVWSHDIKMIQLSSLIGVSWVRLLRADFLPSAVIAPMGHALLFAIGARSPHDGFRRARRPNLVHDVGDTGRSVRDNQRDRRAHRPHGNDLGRAVGGTYSGFCVDGEGRADLAETNLELTSPIGAAVEVPHEVEFGRAIPTVRELRSTTSRQQRQQRCCRYFREMHGVPPVAARTNEAVAASEPDCLRTCRTARAEPRRRCSGRRVSDRPDPPPCSACRRRSSGPPRSGSSSR